MGMAKRKAKKPQDDAAHALGPMPARAHVDGETQKYFSEIMGLVETIEDDAERAALCSNALQEARGKELQLACHPACGRALEKLLEASDHSNCLGFLESSTGSFKSMAMDPSGSHVAEALLKKVAEALQIQLVEKNIEKALTSVAEAVKENILELMENRYGSHVLRRFLFLLAGLSFEKEKEAHRKLGRSGSKSAESAVIHSSFPGILNRVTSKVYSLSDSSMSHARGDSFACLVLQALLKALHYSGNDTTEAISAFLGLKEDQEMNEDAVEQIIEMMENQNASHLIEVILEVASEEFYSRLLQQVFLPNLSRLSTHHFSNFVVQSCISCARNPEQVDLIVKELGKSFGDLLKNNRAGVIASLLEACKRFTTRQNEVTRALAAAVCPQSSSRDGLVPGLLRLESGQKHGSKFSTLGCAMLQTIFEFPQECIQQFSKSFSTLSAADLLEATRDQAGCHVVESFMCSSASNKQKHSLIQRLKGHFSELAVDPRRHYVVTKCYDAADIKLKETIVSELVPVQQELSKTKFGPYILSKLSVAKYAKVPEKWRESQKSKQVTREDFARMFESDGAGKNPKKNRKRENPISEDEGSSKKKKRFTKK